MIFVHYLYISIQLNFKSIIKFVGFNINFINSIVNLEIKIFFKKKTNTNIIYLWQYMTSIYTTIIVNGK